MKKEFSMSNDKVIMNFTAKYCKTAEALLESEGFRRVLDVFLKKAQKKQRASFKHIKTSLNTEDIASIRTDLTRVFKYLTVMSSEEVIFNNNRYKDLLTDKDAFIAIVEDLY